MAEPLALTNGRIITLTAEGTLSSGYIRVADGLITAVGAMADFTPAADERQIDLCGKTVLPGLIDSHCHLINENIFPVENTYIARSSIAGVAAARLALENGITSVRDVGCRHEGIFALQDAIYSGSIPGPRFQAAGLPLAGTGIMKTWRSHSHDGPDEIVRGVRRNWELGAAWVKLTISDGRWRPTEGWQDTPILSISEIKAAVQEAHAKDMRVVCHVDGPVGAELAVTGGVDSIEHGVHIPDDLLREMVAKGTFFVPTVWIYHTRDLGVFRADHAFLNDLHADTIRRAHVLGVKIAAGVDFSYLVVNPLQGLVNELGLLIEAGFSTLEALHAATLRGAELLGWDAYLGSLSPGKLADLIVVEEDPLQDIDALRELALVVQNGRVAWDKHGQLPVQHGNPLPGLYPP
jgi:imidazolonepropionase-like amidohydrolase